MQSLVGIEVAVAIAISHRCMLLLFAVQL